MSDSESTPIFYELEHQRQTRSGPFGPQDPLDTSVPLPDVTTGVAPARASSMDDPVIRCPPSSG